MKLFWHAAAIAIGALLLLAAISWFAVSDYVELFQGNSAIMETKPWRPAARLWFGAITIPLTLWFSYWSAACLGRRVQAGVI